MTSEGFLFVVDEKCQGEMDLNGDGDSADRILHAYHAKTKTITNFNLEILEDSFNGGNGIIALPVRETPSNGDLNGDGDREDAVAHVYHLASNQLINLELACSFSGWDLEPKAEDDLIAFIVDEGGQGLDMNHDGDLTDNLLHVYDARECTILVFDYDLCPEVGIDVTSNCVVFGLEESARAGDLNGDGEISDVVIPIESINSGVPRLVNTELAVCTTFGAELEVEDGAVFLNVSEHDQQRDLNQDGDMMDCLDYLYMLESHNGIILDWPALQPITNWVQIFFRHGHQARKFHRDDALRLKYPFVENQKM
jgi:hypothetical protein